MRLYVRLASAVIALPALTTCVYANCPYPVGTVVWRVVGLGMSDGCPTLVTTGTIWLDVKEAGGIGEIETCQICVDRKEYCGSEYELVENP